MEQVISIMIALMANAIFNKPIDKEKVKALSLEDTKRLYLIAAAHDVAPIVSYALQKNGLLKGNPLEEKFKGQISRAVYRYENNNYELKRLKNVLNEANIPFIVLKGPIVRKFYPDPSLRTSCDIDILVKEENLSCAVKTIKEKLKYSGGDKLNYHDILLISSSNVPLELHFSIKEKIENIDLLLSKAWDFAQRKDESTSEFIFDNNYFIFYHIAHMSYHFKSGGCGVRPFIDLLLLSRNFSFDEDVLLDMCRQCKIDKFFVCCKRLMGVWFENEPYDDLTKSMQDYIFSGGVYGSIENKMAVKKNEKQEKIKNIRYIKSRFILPYNKLKIIYPVIEKHKFLFPFYEVKRWCSLFFKGALRLSKENYIKKNISDESASKIEKLLNDLELV